MRVVVPVLLTLSFSCADHPEDRAQPPVDRAAECEAVRDHVLELRLGHVVGGETPEGGYVDLEAHRAVLRDTLGQGLVATCMQALTDDQIRCALSATDSLVAASCARSAGGAP